MDASGSMQPTRRYLHVPSLYVAVGLWLIASVSLHPPYWQSEFLEPAAPMYEM